MKVFIVYAGRRGGGLESTLPFFDLARELGHDAELILSSDNIRRDKISRLYPEAQFYNFLAPHDLLALRHKLGSGVSFFSMVSPKLVPLALSLKGKSVFYFHAYDDPGLSGHRSLPSPDDYAHRVLVKHATRTVATQAPVAWRAEYAYGKRVDVLPHPPYSLLRPGFFADEEPVDLPVKDYFLDFGNLAHRYKGVDVLLRAAEGTDLPVVLAGKLGAHQHVPGNVHVLNRWLSDGQMHGLVKHARAVVLPYLVPSQFSGCMALAYYFRRPVVVPFIPMFQEWVVEGKTGWFFPQGDWRALRGTLERVREDGKFSPAAIDAVQKKNAARTKKRFQEILEEVAKN